MKLTLKLLTTLLAILFLSTISFAQQTTPTLLKRSVSRHENVRFGYGGTVTILGAPKGSITIEAWQRSEVDLTADIEWQAETQADFDILAQVNNFAFDEDTNHLRILTTGTHDREYLKKVAKNFPKRLLNLPWKIDFHLKVPVSTDIEIDAGHGPISLSGVEGALRINATESETSLTLSGGMASVTIAAGNVNLSIPVKSWRGAGAEIRIAAGVLNVDLAPGFNGDIDADVLRAGKIENNYDGLTIREKPGITERLVRGRAGSGGAFFKFVVGDGTISFRKASL
jgi:hypothetical protein